MQPKSSLPSSDCKLYGANGSHVLISGYVCSVDFVVTEGLHHNVIFGISILRDNNAVIDVAKSSLQLTTCLRYLSYRMKSIVIICDKILKPMTGSYGKLRKARVDLECFSYVKTSTNVE